MISPVGDLVVNPRMYVQVVGFALNFLDLLCDDSNLVQPTAAHPQR